MTSHTGQPEALKRGISKPRTSIIVTIVCLLLIALWGISPCLITLFLGTSDQATKGQFGDQFGFINSLFTALALGGVIYTVLQQSKELELQRQELNSQANSLRYQVAESTILRQSEAIARLKTNLTLRSLSRNHLLYFPTHLDASAKEMHEAFDKYRNQNISTFQNPQEITTTYTGEEASSLAIASMRRGMVIYHSFENKVIEAYVPEACEIGIDERHNLLYKYILQNTYSAYFRSLYNLFYFILLIKTYHLKKMKNYRRHELLDHF